MKRIIITIVSALSFICLLLASTGLYLSTTYIAKKDYILNIDSVVAEIRVKGYQKDTYCIYDDTKVKVENGKCEISIPNEEVKVYVKNKLNRLTVTLNPNINEVIDFELDEYKTYLHLNESKEIITSISQIGTPEDKLKIKAVDKSIVKVSGNTITGIKKGKTKVKVSLGDITKEIEVIVTDLITTPIWMGQNKSLLPCNRYTEEEAALLDEFLEYEIEKVGKNTRMAAVIAARFLTLELPYRVPYFYENGRVNDTGVHFVDGEGRYYKKGMYLAESKKNNIIATYKGPAIWGCPLMNLEDDPIDRYYVGVMMPNGLDCSGFVSWALVQAGFDPGDYGAGENEENPYQMTDLGYYVRYTPDLAYSGQIKVGDLFNYWGHIGILVGIKDEHFYVAESLPGIYFDGVTVKRYSFDNIGLLDHVVLMDSFYKDDGKYSEYWE